MRQLGLVIPALFTALVMQSGATSALALDSIIPRHHHAWGRFDQGSWKRVRVISLTLDAHGNLAERTTTETTTTLLEVSEDAYALRVDSVVAVGRRRFLPPSQVIRRGYCGQMVGTPTKAQRIGTESIQIGKRTIPIEVRRMVIHDGPWRQVIQIHYSDTIPPYMLRRESIVTDNSGKKTSSKTQVNAIAVDVPYKVLSELKQTSRIKTVHETAQGKTETVEVHCPDVPGSVVYHSSREFDRNNRLVRTNTLQLLDYGIGDRDSVKSPPARRRILRRRHR